jgi:acetolactate synthase-1/3 small subunit
LNEALVHTFIAHVEDTPGSLARVISLFRRRGYNIDSLTVGRTEQPGISRVTVVVQADADTARRMEANLYKLFNVLRVEDVTHVDSIVRELALVKVRAPANRRAEVLQLCEAFKTRLLHLGPDSLTFEVTGTVSKLDGLIAVFAPFGILELVRTGAVAMARVRADADADADADPDAVGAVA